MIGRARSRAERKGAEACLVPEESSSIMAVKNPPCTRSVLPRLLFICTIWLAPNGTYSATMIETELRLQIHGRGSR